MWINCLSFGPIDPLYSVNPINNNIMMMSLENKKYFPAPTQNQLLGIPTDFPFQFGVFQGLLYNAKQDLPLWPHNQYQPIPNILHAPFNKDINNVLWPITRRKNGGELLSEVNLNIVREIFAERTLFACPMECEREAKSSCNIRIPSPFNSQYFVVMILKRRSIAECW